MHSRRLVMPAFMLPGDFPNTERTEIYAVYSGSNDNKIRICSAHEFDAPTKRLADFLPNVQLLEVIMKISYANIH